MHQEYWHGPILYFIFYRITKSYGAIGIEQKKQENSFFNGCFWCFDAIIRSCKLFTTIWKLQKVFLIRCHHTALIKPRAGEESCVKMNVNLFKRVNSHLVNVMKNRNESGNPIDVFININSRNQNLFNRTIEDEDKNPRSIQKNSISSTLYKRSRTGSFTRMKSK